MDNMRENGICDRFNNMIFSITGQSALSKEIDLHFQFIEFFVHLKQRCLIRLYSISGLVTAGAQLIKFLSKVCVLFLKVLNPLRQPLHLFAHMI
ncbi:hypothetical protein CCMA1212_001330 [Trichoderma ghanense]|uniref:Uncharacterized protein n=1 Tax=Trichoderma ghanense TaxID=65468 RepID=A0ABY2HH15_9HYPO